MTAIATNRETMTAYIDALIARVDFGQYFADDVAFEVAWNGPRAEGRQAVEGTIRFLHEQAFDARVELKRLSIDGDSAAVEAAFIGKHVAEFNGVPASGASVNVPYMVQYDLGEGRINALRVYLSMDELMRQIKG